MGTTIHTVKEELLQHNQVSGSYYGMQDLEELAKNPCVVRALHAINASKKEKSAASSVTEEEPASRAPPVQARTVRAHSSDWGCIYCYQSGRKQYNDREATLCGYCGRDPEGRAPLGARSESLEPKKNKPARKELGNTWTGPKGRAG